MWTHTFRQNYNLFHFRHLADASILFPHIPLTNTHTHTHTQTHTPPLSRHCCFFSVRGNVREDPPLSAVEVYSLTVDSGKTLTLTAAMR